MSTKHSIFSVICILEFLNVLFGIPTTFVRVHSFTSPSQHIVFRRIPSFATKSSFSIAHISYRKATSNYRDAIDWIQTEKLQDLLPKQDALLILDELLSNQELINDTESTVIKNWDKLERKLLDEKRSIAQILGKTTTDRFLNSIENVDGYDPQAVRAFLGSEAVNKLLAQILYDGIYNFFQTIDVFGNIIGSLPIIGPIRNQIRDEAKKSLDRTVGPLIQTFLRSYTKVAVLEASDFILSPANRKIFASANVKLVASILDRPVNSLIPPSELSQSIRKDVFDFLRKVERKNIEEYVDFSYDIIGDKSLDSLLDIHKVIDASPTLQSTMDRLWAKATSPS
jgi:hypothetical protein